MVTGQCELQQVLLHFSVCGKGKWELAADPSLCSWGTSLHLSSQHFSSVMALVSWLRMERPAPTTQAALDTAAGICAYGTKEILVPRLQLKVKDSEEGVGGSVDHYSLWSRISRQHNSALDPRKCWLHGVNKVVTYPCPSSFTCTFWSIMHIAFCFLLPCERQSQ